MTMISPLSGSSHPDKYLYEIGSCSQILWLFISEILGKANSHIFCWKKKA